MMFNFRKNAAYGAKLILIVLLISNCGGKSEQETANKNTITIPEKLRPINLGQSADFAILAYDEIASQSNSVIKGKVGLLPGFKDQIKIDPTEVLEGEINIIGSEDDTIPANLLSNAKVDMVLAYKNTANITPDIDKNEFRLENFSSKKLLPGCYSFKTASTFNSDITLEGTENDVWVFKFPTNLYIQSGVHFYLKGGAKASNVFWQIAGSAIIGADSVVVGTMIAQQFIEMKNNSSLTGRAFAKNGHVYLDHAAIHIPK